MNSTLKKVSDIQKYIDLCAKEGFVHRADKPKNWDNYLALKWVISNHLNLDAPILDAGGIPASAFLPTLAKLGYKRLMALDLCNPDIPAIVDNVVYKKGDITSTKYPAKFFEAVACLSVIEHGVELTSFFREMSRILKPGGSLIVSADYWDTKIDNTEGRMAYGVPVLIFSEQEIRKAIDIAASFGLDLTEEPKIDFKCEEKTVSWMGFNYTFIVLAFVKTIS